MLLALYDAAIDALEQAQVARRQDEPFAATGQLTRASRLVMGIASGLDPEATSEDSVAWNTRRLALFVLERIGEGDIEPAQRILKTLRHSFDGIREEARELEHSGVIPPLSAKMLDIGQA
jgi:flagellin-specific chaperone FliS